VTPPEALVVGQSGGPTPVINASLAGLIARGKQVFPRVLGLRHGIEGALAGDVVRLDGLTDSDIDLLSRTPAAALGSCRHKLQPGDAEQVIDLFRRHYVRWFCYVGGNDSMDTCARIGEAARQAGYPLSVYGVPKTIDNDLVGTDHCPGYGSAARYWAIATQEATRDLAAMRSYDRVLVLECAGRNAGWLTAATALLKRDHEDGPHVLLPPERAFDRATFLTEVQAALDTTGYSVVAAAETLRDASGQYVAQAGGVDRFGHPIVAGVAETIAQLIGAELGVKARANKPGTFQRTSIAYVSEIDRSEAFGAGQVAAERLKRGESGQMVGLVRRADTPYRCEFGSVSLEEVANNERRLPPSWLAGPGEVSAAFRDYALPLIGPAPEPHFRLA
jgi:ATP-dependent phosphofructokinase / diphosphate-dependent phosphofructokinase